MSETGSSAGSRSPEDPYVADGVRLQKVLAGAGVGSRRVCEDMIGAGRVSVDGQVITEPGMRVDPVASIIRVDGGRVLLDESHVTLALNKPAGVVSAMSDQHGSRNLTEFVSGEDVRLFHVGRLDAETEGLLFLTNDGELAHRITHPSYEVPKTYMVEIEVEGRAPMADLKRLTRGVDLEDGPAKADRCRVVDVAGHRAMIEIVLHVGRNRIVRRMFDEIGHPVQRLVRTRIGPIALGNQPPGKTRRLTGVELTGLMKSVGL